ncbi:CRISPR-associated endonuclease Cas2 [Methanoculleus thermophilus]|jgi:CRISPR-associated protein Cas2|uniref:CRISPR-associated endonuclease Cas2 n=1 Tax=Methanoculleus thermophilus TaxID=2200 RepID=UPI003D8D0305
MFVIIVYDVSVKRVSKVCNYLRRYLNWVQNSVFEGNVTEKQWAEIQHGLKSLIKSSEDSIRLYSFRTEDVVTVSTIGQEKGDTCTII